MTALTAATEGIFTITTEFPKWQAATWEDYLTYRESLSSDRVRLFFDGEKLFVDMGSEGINHSSISDLFAMLFLYGLVALAARLHNLSFGRCLLEKPTLPATSPDLVLYIGEVVPQCEEGQRRRINLNNWRAPD